MISTPTTRILAIETAFPEISVQLLADGTMHVPETDLSVARASALHSAIDELLKRAELEPDDLEEIRVDIGPGSYTGLRVGLALVRTWCEVLPIEIRTAYSTDVLARAAFEEIEIGEDFVVCMDARRNQWFGAKYRRAENMLVRLASPSCFSVEELVDFASDCTLALTCNDQTPLEIRTEKRPFPNARNLLHMEHLLRDDQEPAPVYLMPPL